MLFVFFFKQKTAYELRISDWSSDVCSSDLQRIGDLRRLRRRMALVRDADRIGEPVALHRQPAEQGADRALAPDRVRSEERRVGNEWVSSCNSRWSQYS